MALGTHAPLGEHSRCTNVVSSRGSAPESPPAGGEIKEGERPQQQTLQNAPPSLLLALRNLNLTVEPAQYACNPIRCSWPLQTGRSRLLASGMKVKLLL